MGILVTSFSLILIGIAMFFPILFMPIDRQVQKGNVSRGVLQFNYLIHLIVGSLSVLLYWLYSVNYPLQLSGVVYVAVIIVVVLFYWNTELTKWNLFTASIIFGFIVFYRSINEIVEITPLWPGIFIGLLSAGALSILLHLLILSIGRTSERNSENSLIEHLVKYLFFFLGIRIAWDIVILFNLSVETQYGDVISALNFFWQADSIKLSILIILGMMVPSLYFIILRRKLSGTSSKNRTLLLMVLFVSVVTAEFLYKYFLLQFGIVL
jgi:hypothetical protein